MSFAASIGQTSKGLLPSWRRFFLAIAVSGRAPAQRQVSSRCQKSAQDCKTHFAAFFRVELGAADIVLLDCSGDYAPVVVTFGEAVHII